MRHQEVQVRRIYGFDIQPTTTFLINGGKSDYALVMKNCSYYTQQSNDPTNPVNCILTTDF